VILQLAWQATVYNCEQDQEEEKKCRATFLGRKARYNSRLFTAENCLNKFLNDFSKKNSLIIRCKDLFLGYVRVTFCYKVFDLETMALPLSDTYRLHIKAE